MSHSQVDEDDEDEDDQEGLTVYFYCSHPLVVLRHSWARNINLNILICRHGLLQPSSSKAKKQNGAPKVECPILHKLEQACGSWQKHAFGASKSRLELHPPTGLVSIVHFLKSAIVCAPLGHALLQSLTLDLNAQDNGSL